MADLMSCPFSPEVKPSPRPRNKALYKEDACQHSAPARYPYRLQLVSQAGSCSKKGQGNGCTGGHARLVIADFERISAPQCIGVSFLFLLFTPPDGPMYASTSVMAGKPPLGSHCGPPFCGSKSCFLLHHKGGSAALATTSLYFLLEYSLTLHSPDGKLPGPSRMDL